MAQKEEGEWVAVTVKGREGVKERQGREGKAKEEGD